MQRQESPNNTPEQVEAYIVAAIALVAELQPPTDLRAAVFEQACQLYSGKQIMLMQPQPVNLGGLDLSGRGH
jgi:hypothetical protein